jgi:hypothetical protein
MNGIKLGNELNREGGWYTIRIQVREGFLKGRE